MRTRNLKPLYSALTAMAEPFDWDPLIATTTIPYIEEHAYSWFNKGFNKGFDSDPEHSRRLLCILRDVFSSQTDEDRVHFAESYADTTLTLTDLRDAIWFRKGVWRKEALPATLYPRHRDHSVHTMHNYLLGWYIFQNSRIVRNQFHISFNIRAAATHDDFVLWFGETWCFASLLHDVGYLFEGQVPDGSMALVDEGIRAGAVWATEYFEHRFWDECGLRRADERREARKLAAIESELIPDAGPGTIADFLRNLGSLSNVESGIQEEGVALSDHLAADAFAVWKQNYECFHNPGMAERIQKMEDKFYDLMDRGIPKLAVRVLDHGVCSGLLLLKYSTFWFRMIFGLRAAEKTTDDKANRELIGKILNIIDPRRRYMAAHWWTSVVWATAGTAIHNIQQVENDPVALPLGLSDDPLAFLGILVDILEEWDRPSASPIYARGLAGVAQTVDRA